MNPFFPYILFQLLIGCALYAGRSSFAQRPEDTTLSQPPPRVSPRSLRPSPPQPPSPSAPQQVVRLSELDKAIRLSLCTLAEDAGCAGQLLWVIDLPPFPLSSGAAKASSKLQCIGESSLGCRWSTILTYIEGTGDNPYVYRPLELTIRAQDMTRAFQMGHTIFAASLLRQLESLTITCTAPLPVYAPYILSPMIMAFSAALLDSGVNMTALLPPGPSPPPSPLPPQPPGGSASISPSPPPPSPSLGPIPNTTSDAALRNASEAGIFFSRLYAEPSGPAPRLRRLIINDCLLTGQLPPAPYWLQLPNLEYLDLSRNLLSGPLPETFGPSPPLKYLNLSYNQINGPLTVTLLRYGGCGRTFDLSHNDLRGNLPRQWLSSACTLKGKTHVGLKPRRLTELYDDSDYASTYAVSYDGLGDPVGGAKKVRPAMLAWFKGVAAPAASLENGLTGGASGSSAGVSGTTTMALTSWSYAFWLTYPESYMNGGDKCPTYGMEWDEEIASRVLNGTGGLDGQPFPFTVLLHGNRNLRTPGGPDAGYATAASPYLYFNIRQNACTAFMPLPELLYLWGAFGGCAIALLTMAALQGLLSARQARARVAPAAPPLPPQRTAGAAAATAAAPRAQGSPSQGFPSRASSNVRDNIGADGRAPAPPLAVVQAGAGPGIDAQAAAAGAGGSRQGGSPAGSSAGAGGGQTGGPVALRRQESPPVASGNTTTPAAVTAPFRATSPGEAAAAPAAASGADAAGASGAAAAGARAGGGEDGGSRGMARVVIVAHARAYSVMAVKRLSFYGNAFLDAIEDSVMWLIFGVPWGWLSRAVVTAAVHLTAAGMTYALSRAQRRVYCETIRDCLPYVYIAPLLMSLVAIGLTLFYFRAARELAGTMSTRLITGGAGGGGGVKVDQPDGGLQSLGNGEERSGSGSGSSSSQTNGNGYGGSRSPSVAAPLNEPERWISGLQPLRTSATPSRSGSPKDPLVQVCCSLLPMPARMGSEVASAVDSNIARSGASPRITTPQSRGGGTAAIAAAVAVARSQQGSPRTPARVPSSTHGSGILSGAGQGLSPPRSAGSPGPRTGRFSGSIEVAAGDGESATRKGSPLVAGSSEAGRGAGGGSPVAEASEWSMLMVEGEREGASRGASPGAGAGAELGTSRSQSGPAITAAAAAAAASLQLPCHTGGSGGASGGGGGRPESSGPLWSPGDNSHVVHPGCSLNGNTHHGIDNGASRGCTDAAGRLDTDCTETVVRPADFGFASSLYCRNDGCVPSLGSRQPIGEATEHSVGCGATVASGIGPSPGGDAGSDSGGSGSHATGLSLSYGPSDVRSNTADDGSSVVRGDRLPSDGLAARDAVQSLQGAELAVAAAAAAAGAVATGCGSGGSRQSVASCQLRSNLTAREGGAVQAAQLQLQDQPQPHAPPALSMSPHGPSGGASHSPSNNTLQPSQPLPASVSSQTPSYAAGRVRSNSFEGASGEAVLYGHAHLMAPAVAISPAVGPGADAAGGAAGQGPRGDYGPARASPMGSQSSPSPSPPPPPSQQLYYGAMAPSPTAASAAAAAALGNGGVQVQTSASRSTSPVSAVQQYDTMSYSSSRPGGPWLADRLSALATMATAAAPTSHNAVEGRMPSVAAAAVATAATATVTAMAPRWQGADPRAGAAAAAATARILDLTPEAFIVVNKYLKDCAIGRPGLMLGERTAHIAKSAGAVLFLGFLVGPAAALAVFLAAIAIMVHVVVRTCVGWAHGIYRLFRKRHRAAAAPQSNAAEGGGNVGAARTVAAPGKIDDFVTSLRLNMGLVLGLHTHVAAWVLYVPLAFLGAVLYGLGYLWGSDAVPLPWLFLACNASCLAGVLLLLVELGFYMPAWEHGVCRYPYTVAVQAAAKEAAARAAGLGAAKGVSVGRGAP